MSTTSDPFKPKNFVRSYSAMTQPSNAINNSRKLKEEEKKLNTSKKWLKQSQKSMHTLIGKIKVEKADQIRARSTSHEKDQLVDKDGAKKNETARSVIEKSNESSNSAENKKKIHKETTGLARNHSERQSEAEEAKPEIVCEEIPFNTGEIKFYNQKSKYGFIQPTDSGQDIFFHYEDIKHTKTPRKWLKNADKEFLFKVSYQVKKYEGKEKDSVKAVNSKG